LKPSSAASARQESATWWPGGDHRDTLIDLFVEEPFPFDEEYSRAVVKPLYGAVEVRFVSIETLIRMKEAAGRGQDRLDIEHLRKRLEENREEG